MYVIRVAVQIDGASTEEFEAMASELARVVPERFEGCMRYGFHRGVGVPGQYLLYQEWGSEDVFNEYKESEYFTRLSETLREMLSGPPDSAYFSARQTGPR